MAESVPTPAELGAQWGEVAARTLTDFGVIADFTLASLARIDDLIEEHSEDGEPLAGGFFDPPHLDPEKRLNVRILFLGCYVGEVLRRNYGGEWSAEGTTIGDISTSIVLKMNGGTVNPVGKVQKRLRNGLEDSVVVLGHLLPSLLGVTLLPTAPQPKGKRKRNKKKE